MASYPKVCFLIDDDVDDQEIFSMALKHVDLPVICITADDCSEALKKLTQDLSFIPDYIFLDLNMPKMNGKQCLKEIKKLAHLNHIPVIMYTTSLNQRDIAETKEIGASTYIIKPANISELASVLRLLFNSSPTSSVYFQ